MQDEAFRLDNVGALVDTCRDMYLKPALRAARA
jgi:hypothetical protein